MIAVGRVFAERRHACHSSGVRSSAAKEENQRRIPAGSITLALAAGISPGYLLVVATPHDSLVKRVFTRREDAIGELRSVLPAEVLEVLDLDRLEVEDGSYVDSDLLQRHLDVVYSVPRTDGRGEILVYVLFEHQSSDDPLMAFRVLLYIVRVWERYVRDHEGVRELPLIVPLVLYHDEAEWQSPTSLHDLFPAELITAPAWASITPSFRFLLDDLAVVSDEELQARQMSLLARVALWALRDARFDRFDRSLVAWTRLLSQVFHGPGGREAFRTIFCYIYAVRGNATARELAETIPDPILREEAMTIAEQLRQEGHHAGLQEGRRGMLLKQLKLKFGPLDEATQARVAAADDAALDRYAERVLSAATLSAVLED